MVSVRPGLLELGDDVAAAQAQIEHQRIAGVLERVVDLLDAAGNRVGEVVAGLHHELGELLRAVGHHVEDRRRLLGEAFGHAVEPDRHHVLEVGGDLGEFVADVIGLEVQRGGQAVAGGRDRREASALVFEAVEQVAAALAERFDHGIAGVAERAGDVLALLGEGVVMRRDASLTCSATNSLIWEMSLPRSRWTLLMASRICSAWPTSVSARRSSSARMRTSLSL